MRDVTYSLTMSLDGYVVGPDGRFDWAEPDPEVFAFATDEVRDLDVHLMGRRLYETMVYWEDPEQAASFGEAEQEFADVWNALPKVVFSSTLSSVDGSGARLATGDLAEEIERLRAEPGDGNIGIGGATLAAAASDADLIDEYRIRVLPVLVGGGLPYFSRGERRHDLELLETRTFPSQTHFLRYRVVRPTGDG